MLKTIAIFISFIVFLPPTSLSNNDNTIDSLTNLLLITHDASKKIEIYLLLTKEYRDIDINESHKMAIHALNLAIVTGSDEDLGDIYANLGHIAIAKDSMDVAKNYYEDALHHFELQGDKKGIVTILTILGNIALTKDDLSTALQLYQQGIVLATEGNYKKRLQRLYFNIGVIFTKSGQYAESQIYYSKALDAFLEMGDSVEVARAYNNLGVVYQQLDSPEVAKSYFNKALLIYQNNNAYISIAWTFHNLSKIEKEHGNFKGAIRLLKKSESLVNDNTVAQF